MKRESYGILRKANRDAGRNARDLCRDLTILGSRGGAQSKCSGREFVDIVQSRRLAEQPIVLQSGHLGPVVFSIIGGCSMTYYAVWKCRRN
jgi:hypothetical protein